jgi:hypothetical protein
MVKKCLVSGFTVPFSNTILAIKKMPIMSVHISNNLSVPYDIHRMGPWFDAHSLSGQDHPFLWMA